MPIWEQAGLWAQTVRAVVKASGVAFPRNVTRHTFCSYHLAQGQNAGKTALEAGHSEAMLFAHYRELVTEADATQFWALTPDTAEAICAHGLEMPALRL